MPRKRRTRKKQEDYFEAETVDESVEEVAQETTSETSDDESVDEKKPKKIRKKKEKKLIFAPNAPGFIMNIRDTDSAVEAIKERQSVIGKNSYEIGHILFHIKRNKLYKPAYSSFTQFCQSQEVGYSVAQAMNLVNVVQRFSKDDVETYGVTKLLPITRLKDESDANEVLNLLESGELTDVKAVENVVKSKKSYPHSPTKATKLNKDRGKVKERKGISQLIGKTIKLYMIDDDDTELKTARSLEEAKDPVLYIPLVDGVGIEIRTTDGVVWVARFVNSE